MRHLFISSSETPRTLKKLILTLVCTALVVVITDRVAAIAIGLTLTEPPSILNGLQNVYGVESLWQLSESGSWPGIVFTGSSQMQAALSPHLFDEQIQALTGHPVISVNVSITGANAIVTRDVVRNLIIPAAPSIVIYGIEMRALHINSTFYLKEFLDSPLGYALSRQPGVEQTGLIWLMRHSALIRYRENIRFRIAGGGNLKVSFPTDDRGHISLPIATEHSPQNIQAQFVSFQISKELQDALRAIVFTCQQEVHCIIVNMPIHQDAYRYITSQDETNYQETLRAIVERGKVPFWDFNTDACRQILGDSSFHDLNHLSTIGTEKFTRAMSALYVREIAGLPVPMDSGANCARVSRP